VLGVAGLVAILASLDPANPVTAFRHGLVLTIAFFAAAGVTAAGFLSARIAPPVPVPAAPVASGNPRLKEGGSLPEGNR
jgi:hypothetical protein